MSISPLNKKKVVLIAHIYSAYNQHKIYKFFLWHTHAVLKTHECASVHVMKEPVRNICNTFSAIARAIYRGSLNRATKWCTPKKYIFRNLLCMLVNAGGENEIRKFGLSSLRQF